MNKQDQQALAELNEYLAGRTAETNRISDRHYIAAHGRINNIQQQQNLKQACQQRDNSYQAEVNARPETKTKISKSLAGRKKTAEHEAKVAASNRAKPTDPTWKAALMAGLARRDRPFHAGPYGVFPSLTAAARHVKEQGLLTNAVKKFEKWKKTDPANYYFVET